MATIAYVDHSYHRTTRSTMFLPNLLERHGHDVSIFWDDAWCDGQPVSWSTVASADVVIMFQSYCPVGTSAFRSLHPNVIYVPMFDQFGLSGDHGLDLTRFWRPFQGSKVLSFSAYVHAWATGAGIASRFTRYYPEPASEASPPKGIRGFFWLRRELELGWPVIRELVGDTPFDSFHIHLAGDPGFPPVTAPSEDDRARFNITVSTWFEDRTELNDLVRRANVYFAPRLSEGIGQSYLEAMGRGQCVVAPDGPTMNEYIIDGVNGILFDPRHAKPLDFSRVPRLGAAARDGVRAGRARWEATEEDLVRFILGPSETYYPGGVEASLGRPSHRDPARQTLGAARSLARTARAIVQWSRRA
jgi:hypothetical protein